MMKSPIDVHFLKSTKVGGMGGMVSQIIPDYPNIMPPSKRGGMANLLKIALSRSKINTMPPCHPCHLFLKKFVKTQSQNKKLTKKSMVRWHDKSLEKQQKISHFLILSLSGYAPKKAQKKAQGPNLDGLSLAPHFLTERIITQ